jgi:LysR family nod box-dependent transcriptional activator
MAEILLQWKLSATRRQTYLMRFKGLDLNLLMALEALLTEKNVSRAARRLNLTQPAISAALRRLRSYFQDEILIPHGKRMLPTAVAMSLKPALKEVMERLDQFVVAATAFNPRTSRRQFKIAASDFITTFLVAPLLPSVSREAPNIGLQLLHPSRHVVELFVQGEVDLMIIPEDVLAPDHPSELLFEEKQVVVGWDRNPALNKPLTKEVFMASGHVDVEIGPEQESSAVERQLQRMGRYRRIEILTPLFSAMPYMLPGTLRLAIVGERLALMLARSLPLKIAPIPFKFPVSRQMIQFHQTRGLDCGLNWLIDRFKGAALA